MDDYREIARRRHEQHLRQLALAPTDAAAAAASMSGPPLEAVRAADPDVHGEPGALSMAAAPHDEAADAALARRLAEEDAALAKQHAEDAALARLLEEEDRQQRHLRQNQHPQQSQYARSASPIVIPDDDGDSARQHGRRASASGGGDSRTQSQQEADDAAMARRLQAELSGGGDGYVADAGTFSSSAHADNADDDFELVSSGEAQGTLTYC